MNKVFFIIAIVYSFSCFAQEIPFNIPESKVSNSKLSEFIRTNKDDGKPSLSIGTVSNGSLQNGKLVPYIGKKSSIILILPVM